LKKILYSSLLASTLLGKEPTSEFSPYFSWTGEAWSIADGGFETGGRSLGLAIIGFDWSPEFLKGGTIHVEAQNMHGQNPSGYAGDANALSNIAFDEGTRLFQAWYGRETSWGSLKAGLLALDDDFMGSDYASLFINAAYGPMPIESFNVGAPIWPIGGLGVWTSFNLSETSGLQIGVYDGHAGDFATNEDGLNNSLRSEEGAMILVEYSTSTETFGGNTTWKIVGFHNTGEEFFDFDSGTIEQGLSAAYLVIDHSVSVNLGLWTRLGVSLDEEISTVSHTVEGGVVMKSPVSNRSEDLLGLGYFWTEFGDAYLRATPGVTNSESGLEITYHAPITENLYLQPDIQWIFDAHASRDDVFAVGLRVGMEF
jgi:porin